MYKFVHLFKLETKCERGNPPPITQLFPPSMFENKA